MKLRLQVTLEFLHLENALSCAAQSIEAGADLIEVGETLLQSSGLNSIRVLRERFPKTPIIADAKLTHNTDTLLQSIAEAGATYVTISGAAHESVWSQAVALGEKHNLKVILDFRFLEKIRHRLHDAVPSDVEMVLLALPSQKERKFAFLQEVSSFTRVPIGVRGVEHDQEISTAIGMGASTIVIPFSDAEGTSCQDQVKKMLRTIENCSESFPETPSENNQRELSKVLEKLSTRDIAKASKQPLLLERLYPIHRYSKMVGRIVTLKVWPGSRKEILKFLAQVESNVILVVDAGGQGSAVWDAMLTEVAIKKQLAGVVIFGSITDVERIRERGFPCYTSSITAVTDGGAPPLLSDIPLQIGNVKLKSNDWLLGDDNGLACIPAEQLYPLSFKAEKISQERLELVRFLEKGETQEIDKLITKVMDFYDQSSSAEE